MLLKEPDHSIQISPPASDVGQELQAILQTIYTEAAKAMSGLMDTRNMYIALYDEATGIIEFPLAYEHGRLMPDEEKVRGSTWAPRHFGERQGLTEWVIRHKGPLLIEKDFDVQAAAKGIVAFAIGTKCWLGAPMVFGDQVTGVIGLQNFEREGVFDGHHRDLLLTIAGQAAVAIENARLFEVTRRTAAERQRRLELLQKISARIVEAGLDSEDVLALVARTAHEVSGGDLIALYLYDQEAVTFTAGVRVSEAQGTEPVKATDLPTPHGLVAQLAWAQTPVFIDAVEKHPEISAFASRHELQAFAGLPLTIAGRPGLRATVGVLFINFKQTHPFSDDEQEILGHLANQAAVALAYAGVQNSALAKEQLGALGTAAATLQHRLGNTINVILPAVMRLRYRVGADPTNQEILDTIERNVLFATEVIRRMQSPLHPEPFVRTNINSLLREAIQKCLQDKDRFADVRLTTNLPDWVSPETELSTNRPEQISLMIELDEQLPETYAGGGQLTEVFRVLVENAIGAIYPHSGRIAITSRLNSDSLRQFVEITVSDTGKGIDEKIQARLFKQPVPRKEFGQGAGLGLWLSHIIVRSHQGNLRLQASEVDKGSTFLVHLPVLDQPPPGYRRPQEGVA